MRKETGLHRSSIIRFSCKFEPFDGLHRANRCRSTRTHSTKRILASWTWESRAFRHRCVGHVCSPVPWVRSSGRRPIRSAKTGRSPTWTGSACSPTAPRSCSPTGTCGDNYAIRRRT